MDLAIEIVESLREFSQFGLSCEPAMGRVFTSCGSDHQSVVAIKAFTTVCDETCSRACDLEGVMLWAPATGVASRPL